jgi:hypothetical protein
MKKIVTLFAFFLFFYGMNAQSRGVYINPPPLFLNIYHPNIEFGYSHTFYNDFCTEFGLGVIVPWDVWSGNKYNDVGRKKGRGVLLHFEPKYFFSESDNGRTHLFFGLRTSLFLHDYQSVRYLDPNVQLKDVITYDVKTKGFTSNLLFGSRWDEGRIFMEMSFGMGIRGINVDNNSPIPIENLAVQYRLSEAIEPEKKGNYLRFTMLFNYKFGLAF